uniref:Cadherin domain-containing protein n=1 Tax=Scleropages formosus TaxID=113540 RepID=A0A8C9R562_SCLFO
MLFIVLYPVGMATAKCGIKWRVQCFIVALCFIEPSFCHVRYSVLEEMTKGSFVGNIGQDLGLDTKRMIGGAARIFAGDKSEYVELIREKGILVIKERIDREFLCGQLSPCAIHFQMVLDNPIEFHRVTVEIIDINDNAPVFPKNEIRLEISESAAPGTRFVLESAVDSDVGVNSLQSYTLKPMDYFTLKLHSQPDGSKHVEIVLEKQLDRESSEEMSLLLTAVDGGYPQMSGTAQIHVSVLDSNDNPPVFTQRMYKSSVAENAEIGVVIATVSATDADKGINAQIIYSISNRAEGLGEIFHINESTGELKLIGRIDHEKSKQFLLNIQAKDGGGLTDSAKLVIDITDVNDNVPVIAVMSSSNSIPENSLPGTVIAVINAQDYDSGENGQVHCHIEDNIPFRITTMSNNFYSLQTDAELDRETTPEYNITVTATDEGYPPLSSTLLLSFKVTDINDNVPIFEKSLTYNAYIIENNAPGLSMFSVKASDADSNQNARVSYILEDSEVHGVHVSLYVSVNRDTGVVQAVRSFDYEQIKDFHFRVKAQDGGSPPLSSNVTVRIFIQDQNDNAPQILYPIQTGTSAVAEMVPRSAEVGYLVTKVVAVDVDSGQNSWLSYKVLKATDRALFEVGLQTGEIRTVRPVSDKDAVKQKLTVVVEDNGHPARSATVNVNVVVADSFPEVLSEFSDFTHDKDYKDNLTFYLILALAVVSFLFIVSIMSIISVKCYRWRREQMFYKSGGNLPVIPYYPPLYADMGGTGTLQRVYNYEVCGTTDSRKSDMKYVRPCSQSIISLNSGGTQTLSHQQKDGEDTEKYDNQVRIHHAICLIFFFYSRGGAENIHHIQALTTASNQFHKKHFFQICQLAPLSDFRYWVEYLQLKVLLQHFSLTTPEICF